MNPIRKFTHNLRTNLILEALKGEIEKNDSILDIGCENGLVGYKIQKEFGCKVTGTDLHDEREYDIGFIGLDKLKHHKGKFDVVLLIDTLHHIPKQEHVKTIKDATRLGKKVFIFETQPNWGSYLIDWINSHQGMVTPYAFRNKQDWIQILNDIKAKNIESLAVKQPIWYPLRHCAFIFK